MSGPKTFVLVSGAFHTPVHLEPIISALSSRGHEAIAVPLPGIGAGAFTAQPYDDTKAVREYVQKYIADGKVVTLVCHSYGGYCGSMAVKGLEKRAITATGGRGGIEKVVFLSAFVIPEGKNVVDMLGGELPPWCVMENGLNGPSQSCPSLFFHDLPEAEQAKWGAELRQQNPADAVIPVKGACWDVDVPKVYIFTTRDPISDLAWQKKSLQAVRPIDEANWSTREIASDHAPFLSRTEEFADLLVSL